MPVKIDTFSIYLGLNPLGRTSASALRIEQEIPIRLEPSTGEFTATVLGITYSDLQLPRLKASIQEAVIRLLDVAGGTWEPWLCLSNERFEPACLLISGYTVLPDFKDPKAKKGLPQNEVRLHRPARIDDTGKVVPDDKKTASFPVSVWTPRGETMISLRSPEVCQALLYYRRQTMELAGQQDTLRTQSTAMDRARFTILTECRDMPEAAAGALREALDEIKAAQPPAKIGRFTDSLCLECERPLTQEEQDRNMLCEHCG